ncbi:MAG: hypothetical protein RMK97_04195 [Sutterellaceae bacterium]|nr:hypothetical protein [Burkholderiaceae bacterium]MDW8429692.1 hypothetical protein [Sutterellaceae bacterium]
MNYARLLAASALLVASATALGQSTLESMAAAMQPGEWRVLNRGGDASGYGYDLLVSCFGSDCGDNILNYAAKGLWNPNTREIHFIGQGHGTRLLKHISYSAASNRWALEAKPYWDCSTSPNCWGIVHGYEHSTIDPATGTIYARKFNSTQIFKWVRSSKTWSELPAAPNPAVAVALEWFPEMKGFLLVGGGQIHVFSEATGTWRSLAVNLPMGGYHNVATYNPVHKVAIVGGGNDSRALYKVASDGAVTRIEDAPGGVGIRSGILTTDPVSGKVLLFTGAGTMHEYDVPSNRWSSLSAAIPLWAPDPNKITFRVAIPISSFGVVAFLTTYGSDQSSQVYLYKHAAGTGAPIDRTPPAPPTGLRIVK